MVRSVSYNVLNATYAQGVKTSETYYDIHLGKGDEIADRSWNFDGAGTGVKSESVFEYGSAAVTDGQAGHKSRLRDEG